MGSNFNALRLYPVGFSILQFPTGKTGMNIVFRMPGTVEYKCINI